MTERSSTSAPVIEEPSPESILFSELRSSFGDVIVELIPAASPFIVVTPPAIRDVCLTLRDKYGFDSLMCLSGIDTLGQKFSTKPLPAGSPRSAKPAPIGEEIAVAYHLCSVRGGGKTIALRVSLDRDEPRLPSVSDIWGVANWHEREAYDMYGIVFEDHPNLSRILCPDDWVGFPLRKDYTMPESYGSIAHETRPSGAKLLEKEKQQ